MTEPMSADELESKIADAIEAGIRACANADGWDVPWVSDVRYGTALPVDGDIDLAIVARHVIAALT